MDSGFNGYTSFLKFYYKNNKEYYKDNQKIQLELILI